MADREPVMAAEVLAERVMDAAACAYEDADGDAAEFWRLFSAALLAQSSSGGPVVVGTDGTVREQPEPPPFGSVPFGTMFVPGGVWIHGDNEWHEFPGPVELPPRPPLREEERKTVDDTHRALRMQAFGHGTANDISRLLAIIDRLAPPAQDAENQEG